MANTYIMLIICFQKPYCTLKIKDIQVDQEKLNNIHLLQTTLKEVCEKNHTIISVKEDVVQNEKKQELVIPPPPQTYVQLKKDWTYLQKDSKLLFQYLKVRKNYQIIYIYINY